MGDPGSKGIDEKSGLPPLPRNKIPPWKGWGG